jgi:hypothetical protein
VRLRDANGNPIWVDGPRSALLAFSPTGEEAALADEPAFPLLVTRVLRSALGEAALFPREAGATVDLAPEGDPARPAFVVTPRGETLTVGESTTLTLSEPGVFRAVDSRGMNLSVLVARPSERESALERADEASCSALTRPLRELELSSRARRDLAPPFQAAGLGLLLASCLLGNAARRSGAERKPGEEA